MTAPRLTPTGARIAGSVSTTPRSNTHARRPVLAVGPSHGALAGPSVPEDAYRIAGRLRHSGCEPGTQAPRVGLPSGIHSVLPGIAPRVAPGICHARAGQLTHGG